MATLQYTDDDVTQRLRDEAAKRGVTFDQSDVEDVRHRDNSQAAIDMALRKYDTRASNTPNQDGGGGGGSSSAQSVTTPAQAWNSAPAAPPPQDPRATQLYDELLGRAHQSLAVNPNDPIIKGQTDAYAANQERTRRNYVSDVAERYGPLGNIRGEERMAAETAGQNVSGFQAELMGRELMSRRTEIAQALTQMGGILSQEQQLALQRELAQLDAELKRQGMAQQNEQFGRQLSQQGDQFSRGLAQNQSQFSQSQSTAHDEFLRELGLRQWQLGDQSALNWASL